MAKQSRQQLMTDYRDLTASLANQEQLEPSQVLACLLSRDQIADYIASDKAIAADWVPRIAEGDQILKTLGDVIRDIPEFTTWRASLNPPAEAWWWHPPPPPKILGIFERFDWIWNTFNIVVLTIVFALVVDISPRFYSGGADTAGAFAIVIQSVLAMLTAGGILTKTGREAIERAFKNLKIPQILWPEIKFGLALLTLFLLMAFRTYGLPWAAEQYHLRGQRAYQEGSLIRAQRHYERALKLNPHSEDVKILEIHYDLGRLAEDLQDFPKAHADYQIAVQGQYAPAFNSLARLKILVDKKYDEAVLLLLNGLKLAKEDEALLANETALTNLLYDMQKNLGWARLQQARYREAKAELERAIDLKGEEAPAHCLLAQALDELTKENGPEVAIEALAEWERCSTVANRLNPDEDGWIYQAQLAQLRPRPLITTTATTMRGDGLEIITTTVKLPSDEPETISPEREPGFHLLISAAGGVRLKRQQWTDYYTTTVGATLQRGDQLQPAENAQVLVLCDDLTTWSVPAGVSSGLANGCASSPEPVLIRNQTTISYTDLEVNEYRPYIISPRQTRVLTTMPTLRWHHIPGALTYTVMLTGEDVNWQIIVRESSVVYTGEPPLERGQTYSLFVQANDGTWSHQTNSANLAFKILDEAEVETIYKKIAGLGLSGQAEALAVVQLYIANDLNAEAIESLIPLAANSQSAAIHQMLGDLYHQLGLSLLAEERYERALVLAKRGNDIEGQAIAQVGLAEIYLARNKKPAATILFRQAQNNYRKLGDVWQVNQIEESITTLELE